MISEQLVPCKQSGICLQCGRPRLNPWVRKIPCRRERQPTPIFLPGESHRQRSLVGYRLWDRKELGTTEHSFNLLSNLEVYQMCSNCYEHSWWSSSLLTLGESRSIVPSSHLSMWIKKTGLVTEHPPSPNPSCEIPDISNILYSSDVHEVPYWFSEYLCLLYRLSLYTLVSIIIYIVAPELKLLNNILFTHSFVYSLIHSFVHTFNKYWLFTMCSASHWLWS